ncbi:MAG: 5-guanidino-2-oxopentanoate decarboxylase [Solirubrobacteraceae bacterium]
MPSCGEAVAALLEGMGARTVFGIPGVHTLEIYRGLSQSSLRHVAPRHEQGAGFMADGWARVSGEFGVCTLIGGPGLTNAITPIAQAYHDSIPMLVFSGAVPDRYRDLGEIHDLPDQQALMSTVTAFSHTVRDPAELPDVLARAAEVFESRRPRPVHVALPLDVIKQPAGELTLSAAAPPSRPRAPREAIARAAQQLAAARRPLVLLGGGAKDSGPEALALARRLGAPIGLTINARGTVPHDDELCIGSALSFEPVSALLREADATLLVGAQLSDLDLWGLSEPLSLRGLIRVDIDAEQLDRRWQAEISLCGDATTTLGDLLAELDGEPDETRLVDARARVAEALAQLRPPPEVARFAPLLELLHRVLPADRIVAGDSTQPVYAANHLLPASQPRSWLMPIGYGCLGCALPMAIGAKLAAPERPVLALAGDGGFMFTIQELATLRDLGLPLVALVYNNRGYGEIRDAMDDGEIQHLGTDASLYDLTAVARGFGVSAVSSSSLEELELQLAAALRSDRPTVIEYVQAS